VDDEPKLLRAIKTVLTQKGYEFIPAASGEEGIELAARRKPDAIVLDLSLPGISGLEVCRTIREWTETPILILSVRDSEADKITALELGADDYLTKPFSSGELLARIRALLRRSRSGARPAERVIRAGSLEVDMDARTATRDARAVGLTRTEFDILAVLARNADRVVTTRSLLDEVWGAEGGSGTEALRVHISHLRSKLEDEPARPRRIITEPGVGYRLYAGN
jgi:two-component system KDP operon response regulator KdpE